MLRFHQISFDDPANRWRYQLDKFVQENQQLLAALVWGLSQEWEESQATLGIDLKPRPHFVCCSREALEVLNKKVHRQIQEILGILDGYNPKEEVVILGIGEGQIKLINFQPDLPPPVCFQQLDLDLDTLIKQLEKLMVEQLS